MPKLARIPLIVLVAVALGGCGSSGPRPPTGDFVGRTSRGRLFVAVVARRSRLIAFVCDGSRGIAELMTGSRAGKELVLRNAHAGLLAFISGHRMTGAYKPASGGSLPFTATRAHRPAGFYLARVREQGASATIGWVVLVNGRQQGAEIDGSGVRSAPALNRSTSTAKLPGARRVTAVRISARSR